MLGALSESLGDDLRVEGVGEDLGPVLERAIGRDASRSSVVVALGDDLEGELGLGGVHGEDREVVDDEQVGADVATQGAVEGAVDLGAMQVAEHALGGDDDDASGSLTRLYATARARKVLPVPGTPMKSGLTPVSRNARSCRAR